MGKALSIVKRRKIVEAWQSGKSYAAVCREFNVAYKTVRILCKRFEEDPLNGLVPHYENCGPKEIKYDRLIYRAALWLKRLHRKWGAPFIRMKLQQRYSEKVIPSQRTLQIWFKQAGLNVPRSKPPKEPAKWANKVFEIWQVDGKEEQSLADGKPTCWLSMVDEHSGSLMAAPAFAKKKGPQRSY